MTPVLIIISHQNDLKINIQRKSQYHAVVLKIVHLDLDHDQCQLAQMNGYVRSEFLQVKNQVLGVNINHPNANVHPEDQGAVIVVVAVDHHHLTITKDVIVQVVHVRLVFHLAVITPAVLVQARTQAVLSLAVVQSLDLHLYLGDGGRLVFWIEDELQGKF